MANHKSLYDRLGGGSGEYEKVIGRTKYKVRTGQVNPHELKIESVDGKLKKGNPRFWTVHREWLADPQIIEKRGNGPMTEAEQIDYLLNGKDNVMRKAFLTLKNGLRESGERQEDIHCTHDGVVIEGNRSTIAARLLNNESKSEGNEIFKTVRVMCYPSCVSSQDIVIALGRMHVAKKQPWESGDKVEILRILRDNGMTAEQIALHLGMSLNAVKLILQGGDLLIRYQEETGDMRPEKFTTFYKVANNRKLQKMMLPDNKGRQDPDVYDEGLWDRFKFWVKDDKIKDCRDVAHLTSKKIGLLSHPAMLEVIDKSGITEAINRLSSSKKKTARPGISAIKMAMTELVRIKATQSEKLSQDSSYCEELRKVYGELGREIDRLTEKPAIEAA